MGALAASMGIAYGLRTVFATQISQLKGGKALIASAALNWISAASAGGLNCALMRSKELSNGIYIENEDGSTVYGKSTVAGRQAVIQTAGSRAFLPLPVIFAPAIMGSMLLTMGLMPKKATPKKMVEIALCTFSLTVSLPLSIALFSDRCCLPRESVEEEF